MKKKSLILAAVCAALVSCTGGGSNNSSYTGGTSGSSGNTTSTSASNNSQVASSGVCAGAFAATSTAGIGGTARYEDRTYDSTGFTGVTCKAIRYAKVELMQNGTAVASGSTDASGNFFITTGVPTGTMYVRVLSSAISPFAAVVQDDRNSSTYAVRSADFSIAAGQGGTVTVAAGTADVGQAFNIFDNLIKTQEALKTLSITVPPLITANWYSGKPEGTFYQMANGKHVIDLLGSTADSDAYDDSVILHEMGHYAAAAYSKDSSPGGQHSLTGHYDLRLTWSEGWATFFSSLAKSISGDTDPARYVDTSGTGGTTVFTFELDTPTYTALAIGADNELAVANVLWHIYASPADATHLALGSADIWNVFSIDLPTATAVTFETFYDKWVARRAGGATELAALLSARTIKYAADAHENDNDAATARLVTPAATEAHTFFGSGDKDWYKISAANGTTYTFTTSALGDGADTLMTLYDADGTTQLKQNDDDGEVCPVDSSLVSTTASKIAWTNTSGAAKTVFLKVEPYRPLVSGTDISFCATSKGGAAYTYPAAVGRYGYYTITVQ